MEMGPNWELTLVHRKDDLWHPLPVVWSLAQLQTGKEARGNPRRGQQEVWTTGKGGGVTDCGGSTPNWTWGFFRAGNWSSFTQCSVPRA